MPTFKFQKLNLKGAYLIEGFHTGDSRGSFTKSFEKKCFANAGIEFFLDETFASCSEKNVIRGIHFQTNKPQAKIVSVLHGSVWDVIVDLRPDSKTFKKWYAHELSEENHLSIYVPRGFGHGFVSLENDTVMLYQCDGRYNVESDTGIRFDDPSIGVEWPIDVRTASLSERDKLLQTVQNYIQNPMTEY